MRTLVIFTSLLLRSSFALFRSRQEQAIVELALRQWIEECFGWMKTIGLMRRTRQRGMERVGWMLVFTAAIYSLVRIRNLAEVTS